jgi:hypothetical protein
VLDWRHLQQQRLLRVAAWAVLQERLQQQQHQCRELQQDLLHDPVPRKLPLPRHHLLLLAHLQHRPPLLLQPVAYWRLLLHRLLLRLRCQLLQPRHVQHNLLEAVCEASSLTSWPQGAVSCVHAPAQLSAAPGCLPAAVALVADRCLVHPLVHLILMMFCHCAS